MLDNTFKMKYTDEQIAEIGENIIKHLKTV